MIKEFSLDRIRAALRFLILIKRRPVEFLLFVIVNLALGGMSFWVTSVLALKRDVAVSDAMLLLLQSSTGYLLAIAILASSSSFVVREYLQNKASFFKTQKTACGLVTVLVLLVLLVLASDELNTQVLTLRGHLAARHWSTGDVIQIVLTATSLLLAALCLERVDEYPEDFARSMISDRNVRAQEMEAAKSDDLKT